ncbi:hypothetical protein BJV82DRAFT_504657 [Fennellomyces sp. T-0311]|nr:hypothetical protein BJV82DRAFT_504657 [Fennellomyces sp. T-0311]
MKILYRLANKLYRRFSQDNIRPNETQCCHYSNTDCNKSGKPDEIVKFLIHRLYPGRQDLGRYDISCPGGGWISMGGNKDSPVFKVHWADGSDYPATIEYRAHSY